jgi:thiol-disulfide isomerase/thioredoxin
LLKKTVTISILFLLSLVISDCAQKPGSGSQVEGRKKLDEIQTCLVQNDFERALSLFQEIENKIRKDNRYFTIMYQLALYSDRPDVRKIYSRRLLKAAEKKKFPEYRRGSLYANLAHLEKEKGDLEQAKNILQEALNQSLDPASERAIECYLKPLNRLHTAVPRLRIEHWLNTAPISTEEMRGKILLLDFWSTGCFPCSQLFPVLQEFYNRYKHQGFLILAVNRISRHYSDDLHHKMKVTLQQGLELTKQFLNRHHISLPSGAVTDKTLFDEFGVLGFPTLFIINPHGIIIDFKLGADNLDEFSKKIEELLFELNQNQ